MEHDRTAPALLYKVRGKYGRQDYSRFDNIASSHMRAGRGSIGKVEVDCRFLFKESQWGVIGESKNPAGILFLDLDLRQPPDCKLESATVTVTLEAEDKEEDGIQHRSACPVKFTDHYGPKSLVGEPSREQNRKVKRRTPEMQVMGYGAGGLGVDKEKIVQRCSRWKFSGHLCSSKGNVWYNRLQWDLEENPLERQPTHSNLIHTAFALEHNATRFYMTVHVSGKLARLSDRLRLKFRSKEEENQDIVTKIEWRDGYESRLRLDAIAKSLHPAMQLQNMSQVAMEVPSAMPATFHPATPSQLPPAPQHPSTTPWSGPGLMGSVDTEPLRVADSGEHLQTPSLQELRTAAGIVPQLPSPCQLPATPQQPDVDQASESSGSETLVNSTATTPVDENDIEPTADSCKDDLKKTPETNSKGSVAAVAWVGLAVILFYWLGTNTGTLVLRLFGVAMGSKFLGSRIGLFCKGPEEGADNGSASSGVPVPKTARPSKIGLGRWDWFDKEEHAVHTSKGSGIDTERENRRKDP